MRNLKRALSLGLTAAMISGLMVMGSSAASYADVTSEDNQEAIEVLQAVEIMVGDENGDFNPDQNVTRNEMAVIMSNLMEYNVASYKNTSPFTDVPAWAEPYVAACWTNGITAGYSDTIYGGSDTVTTAQAALMLMKALGYFQYASDFGGDWQLATTRQGNNIDLFIGVDSGVEEAMTRNDVAQLVLNTLEAGTVEASTDGSISIGDVTINTNVTYNFVTSNQSYANAVSEDKSTSNTTDARQSIVELGEQLYMGDLELEENAIDDFGRPSRTWTYDGQEIGTYAKKALLQESYTDDVTGEDMYDLLGTSIVRDDDYSLVVYVDGAEYTAPAGNSYSNFTKTNFTRNNDATLDNTGLGVLTEVYVDTETEEITVAIINTYLAQATSDYNSTRETLTVKVYDSANGISKTLELEDFPYIEDVQEDDFMLVTWADESANRSDKEVKSVSDVEVLTDATVTRFSANGTKVTSMTVDGTKYDSAEQLYYEAGTLDDYDEGNLTDKTYNIYLDPYGNAIGAELYSGDDQYVFITGYDLNGSNIANQTADANAIFTDGTMATIKVDVKDTNDNIDTFNKASANDYAKWTSGLSAYNYVRTFTWFSYTLDETTNTYTLKPVDADAQLITDADTAVTINSKNVRLDGTNQRVNANLSGLRAYGNDDSIYITADTDTITTQNYGTQVVIDEVVSTYTGVQNVDITSDKVAAFGTVFALVDDDRYVIAAVVIGDDNGSTSNYTYIFSGAKNESREDGVYYWEFDAVVEGEIQTLTIKTKYSSVINTIKNTLADKGDTLGETWANGYLFKLSYDADGYVVSAQPYEDATTHYIFANDSNSNWSTKIDDQIIRYMNVGSSSDGSDTLVLISNTLYNNDETKDQGLPLHPDAKFVVAQYEYGKLVKTEYSDISSALAALNDAVTTGNETLEFNGTISAVLDNSGRATWVVFDNNTRLYADQNPGSGNTSIASANVALSGDKKDLWLNLLDKNDNKVTTGSVNYTIYWRSGTQGAFDVFETGTKDCADIATAPIVTGIPDNSSWYIVVEGMDDSTNTVTKLP